MPEAAGASARIRLSGLATLNGWAAATLCTLPFEWQVLARNAAPGDALRPLAEGTALWAAFTLVVCAAVWCGVVLPVAWLVPRALIVRGRGWLLVGSPVLAVGLITWRLNLWKDLGHKFGPNNPLSSSLLWEYVVFGVVLSVVTCRLYLRLDKDQV